MTEISEDETRLLKSFRERLNDVELNEQLSPDYDLVRWIRACENNVVAAEKMLRAHLKWRTENDLENILSWKPPSDFLKRYPYHIGITRDNGIFLIFVPGRVDLLAVVSTEESKQSFIKYISNLVWEEVSLKMKGRETSKGLPVTQVTLLLDFKGFSFSSAMSFGVLGLMKELDVQCEANHPERLEFLLIMNASKIVASLIAFFKSVFSIRTFNKLTVVETDPLKSKEFLLRLISDEELPVLYGGKADSTLNQFL